MSNNDGGGQFSIEACGDCEKMKKGRIVMTKR